MELRVTLLSNGCTSRRVALSRPAGRGRGEAGFTLVELLTVAVMIVLILGMVFPRVHAAFSAETVRNAQYAAQAYVTTARAVSLQKGRTTVFHSAGQRIWVTTDSNGVQVKYRPAIRMDSTYGVTMTASSDSILFNGRGIAVGLSASQTIALSKGGITKSLCVSALGAVLKGGCVS
jgi:type II secretory pathway pseudopilin PulG